MTILSDLYQQAEKLAGRPVRVVEVPAGFWVEWIAYGESPSSPGVTEEEALQNFISHLAKRKAILPEGDTP